ncbi:MAG: peptidylprolyl isomerase [Candidatus Omnitrophica bacterium CG07_land_8_20_14_0_80_42_15]|uniref:Peptidyl-prolyl cis-trans isomerase n=1 Tax=Candidatus Aquitaenariimonas noxiae TaxID=1974741 RepID=A0A2J0KQS1_9BACT|nr:MAG: peptidylprolyl isomerase [Candidatus Omnitrophica bacterium CG07_land_8_20_14_0_80_42_15]
MIQKIVRMKCLLVAAALALVFNTAFCVTNAKGKDEIVANGKKVSFNYTLTVDNQVVDSSDKNGPVKYTQGEGAIIPALAKELEGLRVGDSKKVTLTPKDAYGEMDPTAFKEVDKSTLPKGIDPKVGMILQAMSKQGTPFPVRIAEVKESTVKLDFNHPLAGKTLNFDIKIISIE